MMIGGPLSFPLSLRGGIMRAVVSKRGVDDGNQKVGAFSSPQKKAIGIISDVNVKIKRKSKNFFVRSDMKNRSILIDPTHFPDDIGLKNPG